MKKIGVMFFILILITSILVSAQFEQVEKIEGTAEQAEKVKEDFEEKARNYETDSWMELFGLEKLNEQLKKFNPIFKLFFGIEYSLSLIFFISVIMWAFIFLIIYWPFRLVFTSHKFITFIVSLSVTLLATQGGVIRITTRLLEPIIKNWIYLALSIVIFGVIGKFYSMYMKKFAKKLEEEKEKQTKADREQTDKTLDSIKKIKIKGGNV